MRGSLAPYTKKEGVHTGINGTKGEKARIWFLSVDKCPPVEYIRTIKYLTGYGFPKRRE